MSIISQKKLGYLVGFFIGDGYSNYNKKNRHYNVEFYFNSLRDKEMGSVTYKVDFMLCYSSVDVSFILNSTIY